ADDAREQSFISTLFVQSSGSTVASDGVRIPDPCGGYSFDYQIQMNLRHAPPPVWQTALLGTAIVVALGAIACRIRTSLLRHRSTPASTGNHPAGCLSLEGNHPSEREESDPTIEEDKSLRRRRCLLVLLLLMSIVTDLGLDRQHITVELPS
ncbi:hypothetical protein B0H14DRAFT_2878002, partial [Mycena olivaceomarginata]